MEAEGRLFGGVWGGGAPPLHRGGPHRKGGLGAIANSEVRNPEQHVSKSVLLQSPSEGQIRLFEAHGVRFISMQEPGT